MIVDFRKFREFLSEPDLLLSYLDGLSNSQFRTASRVLGERVLVDAEMEFFWPIFKTFFLRNRKAYLGTLLKALGTRISKDGKPVDSCVFEKVGIWGPDFQYVCMELTETDQKKVLLTLLPLFDSPSDIERLFMQCGLTERSAWIPYLLQLTTKPCAYLLLKAMRYVEHDRNLLIRTCHFLMKRGDAHSFNMASLLRLSFGLEEVRGTFSLSLEPYQLARVEQNYAAFLQVMKI